MSTSLTIEEAVALVVNMDFIPDGETALSMTEAFLEEAAVEYENASNLDEYQLKALKNRMEACAVRHSLVQLLTKSLYEDAIFTEDTLIECNDASTDKNPLVTLDSLSAWAYDRFGIAIPSKDVDVRDVPIATTNTKILDWTDATIKIYADYKIAYSFGKNLGWKRSSFLDMGLIGMSKLKHNALGEILIDLSKSKKYPLNGVVQSSHKTAISKLKKSLLQITGLDGEPFYRPNKADGYKPRFKLIDDSKNAVERAKEEAAHDEFDDNVHGMPETKDYDDYGTCDSESGSKFLKDHDK